MKLNCTVHGSPTQFVTMFGVRVSTEPCGFCAPVMSGTASTSAEREGTARKRSIDTEVR